MKHSLANLSLGLVAVALIGSACTGFTEIGQGGQTSGAAPQAGAIATGASSGRAGVGGASGSAPTAGDPGIANAPSIAGEGGVVECQTDSDCTPIKVPCQLCPDGTSGCPTFECQMGQCVRSLPSCTDAGGAGGSAGVAGAAAGGSGGACAAQGESCLNGEICCSGLQCCRGMPVPPGKDFCGDFCPISDQNLKRDFLSVDPDQILASLTRLPIGTWAYRTESSTARHIGPMAQDFMAAFHVGSSDRAILQVDADGVAFAAIQALNARLKAVEAQNRRLRRELDLQRLQCGE